MRTFITATAGSRVSNEDAAFADLERSVDTLKKSFESLPETVGQAVSNALQPLASLAAQTEKDQHVAKGLRLNAASMGFKLPKGDDEFSGVDLNNAMDER